MITVWPHLRDSQSPTILGTASAVPPAGNGTTILTMRSGYSSARAPPCNGADAARNNATTMAQRLANNGRCGGHSRIQLTPKVQDGHRPVFRWRDCFSLCEDTTMGPAYFATVFEKRLCANGPPPSLLEEELAGCSPPTHSLRAAYRCRCMSRPPLSAKSGPECF